MSSHRVKHKLKYWLPPSYGKYNYSQQPSNHNKAYNKTDLALLISFLSLFLVLLNFLDDHNFIDLTQKKHELDITILEPSTIDDLMEYTLLIRNAGDFPEDIIEISSWLEFIIKGDKHNFLVDQDYCFQPFSLKPNEHRVLGFTTKYNFHEGEPVFKSDEAILIPTIKVSIAGDAGLASEYIKLGEMKKLPFLGSYSFKFRSIRKRLLFHKWRPLIVLTSYPKAGEYHHNKLCSDTHAP